MTITYTPWNPPAADNPSGAKRKPSIHEQAVRENLNEEHWREFVIAPANTDPADPYTSAVDGNVANHRWDLARGTRALDREETTAGRPGVRTVIQTYRQDTGDLVKGTKADPFNTADYPVVMRFRTTRKRGRR